MRSELKEYEAVRQAAEKFVKSVAEGNSEYARSLFTDDAVLFGLLDGVLEHGSIKQFYPTSSLPISSIPMQSFTPCRSIGIPSRRRLRA